MNPDEYCAEKVSSAGSSLHYGLLFVPWDKQRAATAVHAFAREMHGIADECHDPALARSKLVWWRQEVDTIHRGIPQHPVTRALQPAVRTYQLPEERFHEIMDGAEMDLTMIRYPSFEELSLYCHRVAGVVSALCAEIFGYKDQRTPACAHELGLAIQLARIVRDVGADARRNRIYLPDDEMAQFGVRPADVLRRRHSPELSTLIEFQIERAQRRFVQAEAALPTVDRREQRASLALAAIYRTLLDEIRADGCHVLDRRVSLTPLRKLWIAWRVKLSA